MLKAYLRAHGLSILFCGLTFSLVAWVALFENGSLKQLPSTTLNSVEGSATIESPRGNRNAIEGSLIRRGELIKTSDGQRFYAVLNKGRIAMDERTDIRIENPDERIEGIDQHILVLTLLRGRIIVDSDEGAASSFVQVRIPGSKTIEIAPGSQISIVNYDFLDKVEVLPMIGTAMLIANTDHLYGIDHPVSIENALADKDGEVDLKEIGNETFDPETSSSKEFYRWIEGNLND